MINSFSYKAVDSAGAQVAGTISADDKRLAFEALSKRGLSPFELKEKKASGARTSRRNRISKKDLLRYVRQLATLLSANVGVLETLATLTQSNAHPLLSERTGRIKRELRAGKRFSVAFEEHIPELPEYLFRLAELGEATGTLSKALTDAADRMEYEEAMRAEVRSALTYPTFLATAGTGIVLLLFYFVVPRFAVLLGDNIASAPAISRVVIHTGVWLKENVVTSFIGLSAVIGLFITASRNEGLRTSVSNNISRMPIIGNFLMKAEFAGWARTIGVALSNKAPLMDALRLGEAGARSPGFKSQLQRVRKDVRAGRPLEEALEEASEKIDPLIIDLIRTGRSAGKLGEMLLFAADVFEKETKERAKRITALTEPLAILIISLFVGTVILAIVLAMTSLYQFDV